MAKAAHRIEECFQRAKGEAGLADPALRLRVTLPGAELAAEIIGHGVLLR